MGSPLGPTLAKQFEPEYYRRFVDDTFILFKDKDHVNKFGKYLNSRYKNMKFKK